MRITTIASATLAVATVGLGTAVVADGHEWEARPINPAHELPTPVGNPTAEARAHFELEDGVVNYEIGIRKPIEAPSAQPTEPSICSSMSRLHSTAYSIGSVRVIGSMKPLTTMLIACSSDRPRLIR